MLSVEALSELEEKIKEVLPEKLTEILSRTNRTEELKDLLRLLGLSDLLQNENDYITYKDGIIVVIGATEVKEEVLLAIGKNLGFNKNRFEFCLDYKAAQKYDFRKMEYSSFYRVILFGPTPHSGHGKGDSGSIISGIEKRPGYPRVERLLNGQELKITRSNFRQKLEQLLAEGFLTPDTEF